jgi:DNA repair exonuclease SbcCD ATPase subunit
MSKARVVPAWLAVALILVCSAAAATVAYGLLRIRDNQGARVAGLESENRELRARSETLSREADALRRGLAAPPGEPHPEMRREQSSAPVTSLEQAKMLIQFREQLTAANKSADSLQGRIQELEYTLEKTTKENQRLAASEAEFKEKAAAANRVLDALNAQMRGTEERLAEADASNRRLRDDSRAAADKAAQVPRLLRDLDEINRRREGYVSNILRRYRDITDRYRTIASRLDRDNSAPGASELGSIQNAISMTDEDLRQLGSLTAQAARIQQKVTAK